MRVCSYLENSERRLGLLKSDVVVPVAALDAAMPHELSDILRREGGLDALKALDAKAKASDGMSLVAAHAKLAAIKTAEVAVVSAKASQESIVQGAALTATAA